MSKISVVLPVYNVEKYLDKCIKSILNQSFKEFELIIVNDGSTDKSLSICKKFANENENIKLISKKNGGLSSARNVGLEYVKNARICFVDSDDFIEPNMFEVMYKKSISTEADIIVSGVLIRDMNGNIIEEERYEDEIVYSKNEALVKLFKDDIKSYAWNKIYKSQLFEGIRFPEGRNFEDIAVMHNVFAKATKVVLIKEKLYNYIRRPGSISLTNNFDKEIEKKYNIYLAYKDRYEFVVKNEKYNFLFNIVKNNYHNSFQNFISAVLKFRFENKYDLQTIILKHSKKGINLKSHIKTFLILNNFILYRYIYCNLIK
tara:strand:+ start:9107 stop:10057 length:951 start_codon:yes stop_codon:yes gene_type:complete